MAVGFIDDHRDAYGVEPICTVVRIAPATYQWQLSLKGEVIWGRIESNGQLEVSNQSHGNPSKAFQAATGKPGNGWYYWHSRAASGEWQRIDALRSEYRRHVGTAKTRVGSGRDARYGVARPHRPTDGSSGLMADARLRRSRGPRCGGAPGGHPCSRRLPLIDDGVVRCANQGCTLCLADADPVVTGWPLS